MVSVFISITVFVIVVVVHELAHGYTAYLLGDTTAKDAGRLTFNPLAHADLVGTIILPVLLVIAHSPVVFGWAKPVPVNPCNFRNPRRDMLLTSLAGPGSNFALAAVFALIFKSGIFPEYSLIWSFLLLGVIISLILGIFNLIPIPPLDGAHILAAVLPPAITRYFVKIERYGFIILLAFLYLGLLDKFILPLVGTLMNVLVG